jgi:spermidine synthase
MASAALIAEGRESSIRLRFVATIFTGSFLLFLVQPMIARMALPRLGGAPAVWNSAMLVYQALLLAGYAYSHWLGRLAPRRQAAVHLAAFLVAAAMLPIGLIDAAPPPNGNIFLWVPWFLVLSIGPLFLVVSAQAPLMQRWFALSGGDDPYPLYAASNLGSFSGLIFYPLVIEPLLPIAMQRMAWSVAYGCLALLVGWCALGLTASSTEATAPKLSRINRRTLGGWVLLAAIPSGLMLSTTLHITTDIVAMPLLWVLPLGLYLLSFSVAFAKDRRLARMATRLAPLALLIAACGVFSDTPVSAALIAIAALFGLFLVSVAIHSALYERRPDPAQLTTFYLAMSVGGVLGGLFCALLAPMIFDWTYEHPILVVAAAFLLGTANPFRRLQEYWGNGGSVRLVRWGIPLLLMISLIGQGAFGIPNSRFVAMLVSFLLIALALLSLGSRILFAGATAALMLSTGGWDKLALSMSPDRMTRSFFGIYAIRPGDQTRILVHGTTIHGIQRRGSAELERSATSYYAPHSGVGLALAAAPALFGEHARIDVVGLGAGTLACYSRPGQQWLYYEIDPAVVRIARNPQQFTFLSRCLPNVPVTIGDARLSLERSAPAAADMLIVDAFSSDSVPMHLLTREAFRAYRRHLSPGGLLLVHISNRYLDLRPVVAAQAQDGWHARLRMFVPSAAERQRWEAGSIWIALSPDPHTIARLERSSGTEKWTALQPRQGFRPWTDDYGSILPIIKWGN